ncbi:MAG TPA: SIMPL domain-containing protein, partial [Nitrososphaera sp.]|nr:SIMPL domain-containing protein [Nitrososphaera sp.]
MNSNLLMLPLAPLAVVAMWGAASAQMAPYYDPTTVPAIPDTNNTVSVTGTAMEKVEPDRVMATFAVETMDEAAGDALRANSEAMNAVLAALEEAGVEENETHTAYFSIYPTYNYTEFGAQELTGYTVTNSITVGSSNLTNVSDWIDAAVNAGANRVDSLSFTLSEERLDDIRGGLTQDAIDNARGKADALAQALDVEITGVKSASLFDFNSPPVMPLSVSFAAGAAESIAMPITPGEQTVTAT